MAFARFSRLPVKALAAMPFARYEADQAPTSAGLFGISNSGQVARSIEAVALARAAGLDTVAVTGNVESGIAREAAATVGVPIAPMGRAPGLRSYTVQLVSLLLCAIRVGELRQVLTSAEADRWRQRLVEIADCMAATIEAVDVPARQAAERFSDHEDWVFLGSGPHYATALFSAAKLVESCGANAWGQDIEEWGHIQFFNSREPTPTCLIVPPGRSLDRALELLSHVRQSDAAHSWLRKATPRPFPLTWTSSCRYRDRCRNCSRRWSIAWPENSWPITSPKPGNPIFSRRGQRCRRPAAREPCPAPPRRNYRPTDSPATKPHNPHAVVVTVGDV